MHRTEVNDQIKEFIKTLSDNKSKDLELRKNLANIAILEEIKLLIQDDKISTPELIAILSSCLLRDMPLLTKEISVDIKLSAREFNKVQAGFSPKSMDDRWFIYYDDHKIYMHRSLSGCCIYTAEILQEKEKYSIQQIIANRDPSEYKETEDNCDRVIFKEVLNSLLADKT